MQAVKKTEKRKKHPLKRGSLRRVDYFMLGFGSMVGVGWAVSSNHWLAQAGGAWTAFIGFLLGTLLLIPIGMVHGELMGSLPIGGGVMVYTYRAFGTGISFISSWFLALAYLTILPWEAIYINRILSNLFPVLRSGHVLYHIGGQPVYLNAVLLGLLFTAGLFLINYRGSKLAAKMQNLFSWLIIAIGLMVIIVSAVKGSYENLFPVYKNIGVGGHKNFASGVISMIVLVPFFMAGFDTIPQSVEEASPSIKYKSIARTLLASIALAGLFYAAVILSTASVLPWDEYAAYEAPAMAQMLGTAYGGSAGRVLYTLVMIGTLAGLFSTWNGMFLASAKLLQSMGKSGLLPEFFAREHEKYKTPVGASLFCLAATAAGPFVGMKFIDPLTGLGSVAFVLGWLFTCLSAVKLRRSEPELPRHYKIPGGRFTLWLAVIISAAIVLLTFIPGQTAFMGYEALSLFAVWLLLGGIFYYFTNFGERGISEKERSKRLFGKLRRYRSRQEALKKNGAGESQDK